MVAQYQRGDVVETKLSLVLRLTLKYTQTLQLFTRNVKQNLLTNVIKTAKQNDLGYEFLNVTVKEVERLK